MNTSDHDALRRELVRLIAGLDFYRDWRLVSLRRWRDGFSEKELSNEVVMPGSVFLQLFDDAPPRRAPAVVNEVRAWYSHAASDLNYMEGLSDGDRNEVHQFLRDFQERLGFSFHSEAKTLRKVADRVMKRGSIVNRSEYYHLAELRNDQSQFILEPEEMARISEILDSFEESAARQ